MMAEGGEDERHSAMLMMHVTGARELQLGGFDAKNTEVLLNETSLGYLVSHPSETTILSIHSHLSCNGVDGPSR